MENGPFCSTLTTRAHGQAADRTVPTASGTRSPCFSPVAGTVRHRRLLSADTGGGLSAAIKNAAWGVPREGSGGTLPTECRRRRAVFPPGVVTPLQPERGLTWRAGSQKQLITASTLIFLITSNNPDSAFGRKHMLRHLRFFGLISSFCYCFHNDSREPRCTS